MKEYEGQGRITQKSSRGLKTMIIKYLSFEVLNVSVIRGACLYCLLTFVFVFILDLSFFKLFKRPIEINALTTYDQESASTQKKAMIEERSQ